MSLCRQLLAVCYLVGVAMVFDGPEKSLAADRHRVYFGTYTSAGSKGIYTATFDVSTGDCDEPMLAAELANPSFLAIDRSGRQLYSVSEVAEADGKPGGALRAYRIEKSGQLKFLNQQSSEGVAPCHVSLDREGTTLLVANYGSPTAASFPIDNEGKLGAAASIMRHTGTSVDKGRQEAPHPHSINLNPSNKFAVVADLGIDRVAIYKFNPQTHQLAAHRPAEVAVAPGAGPRHFAFHPTGKFGYVINELNSTITAFAFDAEKGTLSEIQNITTLPENSPPSWTAEVVVHPSGKFVYGSNRGHDSLAIFRVNQETGKLTAAGHQPTGGKIPRNFVIDPTGTFVLAANQDSHTVNVMRINQETGLLTPVGKPIEVKSPVCVRFVPQP